MQLDTTIRRLSFAEARSSGSEALVNIAQHRQELLDAIGAGQADAKTQDMAERTQREQRHKIDRTA